VSFIVAAAAPVWATVAAAVAGQAAFAGTSYASYRAGVAGLLAEGTSLAGRLDTVALSGEPVLVLETAEPGVLHVELPAQPNGDTGYAGYVDAAHVGDDAPVPAPITTAEGVASVSPTALDSTAIFDIATSFLGVPYLWGGVEGAGIDCSGLIHIAARLGGRVIPRDAHHQWAATRAGLTWDDLEPGDILYFGGTASLEGIDHVGFFAGEGRMLHAPETGRRVVLEPLSDRARARSVAFGRLL
jgi:gamma-D-glutamyl-L-lysine dipeptidyl-peptidase